MTQAALITRATLGQYTTRTLIKPFSRDSVPVSSFAEALDGELLVLDFNAGRILALQFAAAGR